MTLLRALQQAGVLRTLDDALAQSLRRLDPQTPDTVLAAAALASLAVAQGHAGFDPARPRALIDADLPWPDAETWQQTLAASPWVATPDASDDEATAAPLVLEHGLIYLRRYREYERRLALQLRRIAAQPTGESNFVAVAPLFASLFPDAGNGDHQARAAALALRRTLLLVTGGPGTGKTTTIARLLLLRVAQTHHAGHAPPRIALAAPTGRAAERMAASLRRAVQEMAALGVGAELLAALPTDASTMHRLLGTIPGSPRFRHHADHPLPFDIVVVDESSMVDLPLMCKLTEAVADGAQLVLLGDPDQLPSVEAGDVLAAILSAAGPGDALLPDDAQALRVLLGDDSSTCSTRGVLHGHRVHLQRGWRQSDTFDLSPLAAAVREGDADRCLALLRSGELAGVHFHEHATDPLSGAMGDALIDDWRRLANVVVPGDALEQAGRLRLLTALRDGPDGASSINTRIEDALAGVQHEAYFGGRLVMVTENSYRMGLFNGDIGVCIRDAEGDPMVWFAGGGPDDVRGFNPSALPSHVGAFATTVHKAQGSEFSMTCLVLPQHDARHLSRELLYTGITRARDRLHIYASETILRATLARNVQRVSGLSLRLDVQGD